MKVERVFTRSIVSVARHDNVEEAAAAMRRFHVGSLLVLEHGPGSDVVGIVTDRDLVMLTLADGLDARRAEVERVMTPVVATVPEGADSLEAIERMRAAGVRRLMVTNSRGLPAGIVSVDDLVDGLAAELTAAATLMKVERRKEASQMGQPRTGE